MGSEEGLWGSGDSDCVVEYVCSGCRSVCV